MVERVAVEAALRAYLKASADPMLAGAPLLGLITAHLAMRCGGRQTATLLYGLGDRAVELSPPERAGDAGPGDSGVGRG